MRKAVSGGRKEKIKRERDFTFSKHDPRSSERRKIDLDAAAVRVRSPGKMKASDCTFVHSWEDMHSGKRCAPDLDVSQQPHLTDSTCDEQLAIPQDNLY